MKILKLHIIFFRRYLTWLYFFHYVAKLYFCERDKKHFTYKSIFKFHFHYTKGALKCNTDIPVIYALIFLGIYFLHFFYSTKLSVCLALPLFRGSLVMNFVKRPCLLEKMILGEWMEECIILCLYEVVKKMCLVFFNLNNKVNKLKTKL